MLIAMMRNFIFSAWLLLLTISAIAQPRLPKGYYYEKLKNGLDVVVIENDKVPLATIEIAVKNGAYTEGPEFSGLSHLFEHMFFKSNEEYPDQEKYIKRTQELGAFWNGTTDVERVNYFFTFDKDSLEAGLRFMNAAIRYPIFKKEDFEKERPVVDGEFQRSESNPGHILWYEVQKKLWGDLFTRKNPIGDHHIINTATPEKMMAIKNKYYHPNNSILVICGDVERNAAFRLAKKIYGDWKHSGFDPFEKYPIPEFPPLNNTQLFIKESSLALTPQINISFRGPGYKFDSAGTVYADVLNTMLALNSSKWHQALVDKGLASTAEMYYQTLKYPGSLDMWATPNPEKMKEFYAEVGNQFRLMGNDDYFTEEQLQTAKEIIKRNQIRAKEKPSELPKNVTYNWCSTSYEYMTDYEQNCMNVTKEDIKAFIHKYITTKPFVAGMIISPEMNKKLNPSAYFKPF
jgi:zinc protease